MIAVNHKLFILAYFLAVGFALYPLGLCGAEENAQDAKSEYYDVFCEKALGLGILGGFASTVIGKGQDGWVTGAILEVGVYRNLWITAMSEKTYYAKGIEEAEGAERVTVLAMENWANAVGLRYYIDKLPVVPFFGLFLLASRFDIPDNDYSNFFYGFGADFGFDVPVNDIVSVGLQADYSNYRKMDVSFPAFSTISVVTKFRAF